MSNSGDLPGDPQEDMRKAKRAVRGGNGVGGPLAFAEGVFGSVAGLVAVAWLISLYWVPDTVPSETWLTLGLLGLLVSGLPAAAIYGLRRGGLQVLGRALGELMG